MPKKLPYRLVESKKIFKGYHITLFKDRFVLHRDKKKLVTRELVDHPGAVAILPLIQKNKLLLIRQFRYSSRGDLWEIPAGTLEKGEAALDCAQRELEEETGYKAKRWMFLTRFYLAPGISNEIMTLYRAQDLLKGRLHLDHDEWIKPKIVTIAKSLQMIRSGLIRDAKTILAILWLSGFKRK